jgi:pimeloyl-ACP methyl ester carboxylesterase
MTMPWPYLVSRLLNWLSLALLATGLWFVADWLATDFRGGLWLVLGAALLVLAMFGREIVLIGLRRERPQPAPCPDGRETVIGSGGSRLYVESYGPRGADPIVLTCGWGFDRSLWAGVIAALKNDYRVLVWDPPGVGRSGRPFDNVYSAERFAGDLGAVVVLADGRAALVVGHGLGALAVLELFRGGPPKGVAGAVLLNAAAESPLDAAAESKLLRRLRRPLLEPLLHLDVWLSPLVQLGAWASYLNGTAQLAARSVFGLNPSREVVDRAAFVASAQSPGVQARALKEALKRVEDPAAVSKPLLVVAGGRDVLVAPDACRRTAEAAPEGSFVLLEQAGHAGPLEAPAVYAQAIAEHARKAFGRSAAIRTHAETLRARAKSFTAPSL